MTFQDLGLIAPILSALGDMGYEKPSPIQEKAIPPALAGRDVLGCAQTGTGKTCAFAAPILQRLSQSRPDRGGQDDPKYKRSIRPIRALILTPTRELALQIQESFVSYGKNLPLRSAVIFGGVGQQPQVDALRRGVDILVATPGRLQDLHDQGFIHVENLEIFVLDEADRMLDMGFIHDVRKILTWLPQKKQTLFFSATMPPEVQGLVDSLLTDPVKVAVDPVSSPVEIIDQRLFYVDRGNKSKLLAMLVKHPDVKNALVFTRTKHGANKVAGDLEKAGVRAAAIHGNKSQTARQQALSDFKAGKIKALVATDIAARGLDIEELSHVFNYNLPDVPETYVHRIGRTGRAGHGGTAVSFCEFGEKELLAPIEKLLKKSIPVVEGHPFPMQVFEAPKRDKHGKIVNADDAEARQAARERKQQRQKAAAQKPAVPEKAGAGPRPARAAAPEKGGTHPPKQKSAQPPQGDRGGHRPAQTTASGKRASAGYKPSRTLDEAMTAMSPKKGGAQPKTAAPMDDKEAAFQAWLAEERAIQAKQAAYYKDRDPLAGDVVMDATARLLAPKTPEQPKTAGQARRDDTDRQISRQERGKGRRQEGQKQPPTIEAGPKPARKPALVQQSQKQGKAQPHKSQPPKKVDKPKAEPPRPHSAKPTAPKAAPASVKEKPKKGGLFRRGRPMEPAVRPSDQKDSTEQQSLMRPYYFNPNGD